MKRLEAVLFDIDGTLLDTNEFILQAFEHALATHNVSGRDRRLIRSHVGRYIIDIYKDLAPEIDPNKLFQTHAAFQKKHTHLAKLYPNTKRVLKTLKKSGVKTAVVTNRMHTAKQSLEAVGIAQYIDLVISPDDGTKPKPHPQPVFKALKHFGITTAQAVMVGDSENDILSGKHARTKTVGVTYGFLGKKISRYNPDYFIHDIVDLLPIVLPK